MCSPLLLFVLIESGLEERQESRSVFYIVNRSTLSNFRLTRRCVRLVAAANAVYPKHSPRYLFFESHRQTKFPTSVGGLDGGVTRE